MPEVRPKLFRRVVRTVLLLIAISAALLAAALYSDGFALELVRAGIDLAGADGQTKVSIDAFSGNLASGMQIKKIRLVRRSPVLDVTVNDLFLSVNFNRIMNAGVFSLSGKASSVQFVGLDRLWLPLRDLPAYHGPACFASIPGNVEIHEFSVASAQIIPHSGLPGSVSVNRCRIYPDASSDGHRLEFAFAGFWHAAQIASGSVQGTIRQKQKRFDGKAELDFAGQNLTTELCLQQKRRENEISGYIASASIDLARLSHWLSPLWQNSLPFGFDGTMDCTGSWLFNSELGFLGNLSGHCKKLRIVALGFYFALVELNGNWKLFDGNLQFSDCGSLFAGFPANLAGAVEAVARPGRNWSLSFVCPAVDFASLTSRLPWGLKYGFSLPDLAGSASVSLTLTGKSPDIACRVKTDCLTFAEGRNIHMVTGHADYSYTGPGSSSIDLAFTTESSRNAPLFFRRFHSADGNLVDRLPKGEPCTFQWKLSGPAMQQQRFTGQLHSGSRPAARIDGSWHAGTGHLNAELIDLDNPRPFSAGGVQFLDLILAR